MSSFLLGKVNDPLQAFVENPSEVTNVDVKKLEDHRIFLWRQDKETSLSDWTIELIPINGDDPAAGDCQKPDVERIFYIHRCILANSSTYFRSLFNGQTVEQNTKTSTIRLHPRAIEAFPVFLDCIYNHEHGRMSYCREDAVALRHLAMYFGVDILLEDITDIIMKDFKRKESREIFQNDAIVFCDDMLLIAIKIQDVRQETFELFREAIVDTLESNPTKYLQDDNDTKSAWKHVMTNAFLLPQSHFHLLKYTDKIPDLLVTDSGLNQVNGLYKLVYFYDSETACTDNEIWEFFFDGSETVLYTNGVCWLYRSDKEDWGIMCAGNTLYTSILNSHQPPSTGWSIHYRPRIDEDPGPTIKVSFVGKKSI